jgi:hypothetical protein
MDSGKQLEVSLMQQLVNNETEESSYKIKTEKCPLN